MNSENLLKIERMHLLGTEGPTKAFCDILLFDSFVVKGFRIVQGKEDLFVSMPSEKGADNKWYETFYPVSGDIKKEMGSMILKEFNEQKARLRAEQK